MPTPVQLSLILLVASMLPDWLMDMRGAAAVVRLWSSAIIVVLGLGVVLRLVAVRYLLAILLAISVVLLIAQILGGRAPSLAVVAVTISQIAATMLLFHRDATAWFGKAAKPPAG